MAARGVIGVYNGTKFVRSWPFVYNGSSWVRAIPYVYNGSSWVMIGGAGTMMIPYEVVTDGEYNVSGGELRLVREDPE